MPKSLLTRALALMMWAGLLVIALTAPSKGQGSACSSLDTGYLAVGFTFTHLNIATNADALCQQQGVNASISGMQNIVLHYDDPQVRQSARETLRAMFAEGVTTLRTIIWYRHAEDALMERIAQRNDSLGLLVATDGQLSAKDMSNISSFVRDAQSIGFNQVVLVLGPQGTSNPKCRANGVFGECYDSGFTSKSWSVVEQLAKETHGPAFAGTNVILDIAVEMCFVRGSPQLLDRNLESFANFMLSHYRDEFGDSRFIMSCGGGAAARNQRMLENMTSFFQELKVRPAFIDLHLYLADRNAVESALLSADATASKLAVPLVIGETFVDHSDLFQIIAELRRSHTLTSLKEVIFWPLRKGSPCRTYDVNAPYQIPAFETALGEPRGRVAERCKAQQ
jgi:hypothetical protein